MNNKEKEFRVIDNRIITEKQYQSEKNTEKMVDLAFTFSKITIPLSSIFAIFIFFSLVQRGWGWFSALSVGAISGVVIFIYLVPAISIAFAAFIFWLIYKSGGF